MKREIKFRGKVKTASFEQMIAMLMGTNCKPPNEGVWVYGDIRLQGIIPYIHNEMGKYPIDVDTIGQFTGLKDKNGKEIYEGDIVKMKEVGGYDLEYIGVVRYYEEDCRFGIDTTTTNKFTKRLLFTDGECSFNEGHYTITYYNEYEVLGNIFDNPELLTEK